MLISLFKHHLNGFFLIVFLCYSIFIVDYTPLKAYALFKKNHCPCHYDTHLPTNVYHHFYCLLVCFFSFHQLFYVTEETTINSKL